MFLDSFFKINCLTNVKLINGSAIDYVNKKMAQCKRGKDFYILPSLWCLQESN